MNRRSYGVKEVLANVLCQSFFLFCFFLLFVY